MTNNINQEIPVNKLDQLSQLWSRMIACIIHDLTTPLVVTRMAGSNVNNILSKLISGYQLAVEHHLLEEEPMRADTLKDTKANLMFATGDNINHIFEFFQLLPTFYKQLSSNSPEITELSIKHVLRSALQKQSFANEIQRPSLHLDVKCDFHFHFTPLFVECLFEQLLANAIKLIQQAGKGEIYIHTSADNNKNMVYFRNSAMTEKEQAKQIFEQFFLKTTDKIVPGLGFCKLALMQRGGDIQYQMGDKGGEFAIHFPSV